jgi:hypothetical protein
MEDLESALQAKSYEPASGPRFPLQILQPPEAAMRVPTTSIPPMATQPDTVVCVPTSAQFGSPADDTAENPL